MDVASVTLPATTGVRAHDRDIEVFDLATNCGEASTITLPAVSGVRAQSKTLDVFHASLPSKVSSITLPSVTGVRAQARDLEVYDLSCVATTPLCPPDGLEDTYYLIWGDYYPGDVPPDNTPENEITLHRMDPTDYISGYGNWNPTSGNTYHDVWGCASIWQGQHNGPQGLEAVRLMIYDPGWGYAYTVTFEYYTTDCVYNNDPNDYGHFDSGGSTNTIQDPTGWYGWEGAQGANPNCAVYINGVASPASITATVIP